jgi:hypothetical protein
MAPSGEIRLVVTTQGSKRRVLASKTLSLEADVGRRLSKLLWPGAEFPCLELSR